MMINKNNFFKIFRYTSYSITIILFLVIVLFCSYLLIKRFEYLFIKFPNEAKTFLKKFSLVNDIDENQYYQNNSDVNKKEFYEITKKENINRTVYFSKNSSFDSKYGSCKSGYFVLNKIDNSNRCDKKYSDDDFCHISFNSEHPLYSFNFICSSDGPGYNLILLKKNHTDEIWIEDNGFYFKLKKID